MHNHWKLGLLALVSLTSELTSASACRPRKPSLSRLPFTTDGTSPIGDGNSASTWHHYPTSVQSGPGPQHSGTWNLPGPGTQESIPLGETTVMMSHGITSSDETRETNPVPTNRPSEPNASSWDQHDTTKQSESFPVTETTKGTSAPVEQSGGETKTDETSLTGGVTPSGGSDTAVPTSGQGQSSEQPSTHSEPDTDLPDASSLTIPNVLHPSQTHGVSEEIPSSSGAFTGPMFETASTSLKQTKDTEETNTIPADEQETPLPTGSHSDADTSVMTGPLPSHSSSLTSTPLLTSDVSASTGPTESRDKAITNTEVEAGLSSSSGVAITTSQDLSEPAVFTSTPLSSDDAGQHFDTQDTSRPTSDVSSSNGEDPSSLATATGDQDITTNDADEQTLSDEPESQAPITTRPEAPTTISARGTATEPSDATTRVADPKSTATNDGSLSTSYTPSKTRGQQTTVTGTDGETATWSAVRDPELSDVSQTQTQTDDDGAIIVIFPGGWKWSPVGGGKKGGPTPTAVPTVEGDGEEDPDDEDDEEERCTSTRPPTCTMTMSYYTNDKGEGTSTRIGTCSPVTGCVLGDQSTTTTTIASEIPRITGELPEDEGIVPTEYLPVDEEIVEYYLEAFKRWGISNTDEEPEAQCESGLINNGPVECLELFSGAFCDVVNEDETHQVSRNFTFEDVKGNTERSLRARQNMCASYLFNFDWTGADGDCKLSCSEAFEALKTQCTVPILGRLGPEGTLDVGCGNYTYQANREALFDPSSSTVFSSTTSTTVPSSTTTPSNTDTKDEPEPTQTNVYYGVHNLQCNNEDDYPGHADVLDEALAVAIDDACTDMKKKGWHLTPKDDPISWKYSDRATNKHRFTWSWTEGCTAENEDVNLSDPLDEGELDEDGRERCVFMFRDTWTRCNNGGVGGSLDVGCIQYWLEAGV